MANPNKKNNRLPNEVYRRAEQLFLNDTVVTLQSDTLVTRIVLYGDEYEVLGSYSMEELGAEWDTVAKEWVLLDNETWLARQDDPARG